MRPVQWNLAWATRSWRAGAQIGMGLTEPVRVTVPHRLGRAEARRRVAEGLIKVHDMAGAVAASVQQSWNGDQAEFSAVALGQRVVGRITVGDTFVDVEVQLPGLLGAFAGQIARRVQEQGARLLGKG